MIIDVVEKEFCQLEIHYEANNEQIENKRAEVLSHFKRAPVPGFRKNKTTLKAIQIHYRSQIEESLKRALMEEAYHNVIGEKNIKPLGNPSFNSSELKDNKFSCDFSLNKKPDFELNQYKDFNIVKPPFVDQVTVAEEILQDLRVRNGENKPFDENDRIQLDDNVVIDYECFEGENRVDFLSANGELLTVGKSHLLSFDESILGMKAGETRTFSLSLPEDAKSTISGKLLTFTVTLHTGAKITPMPLNDELANKLGRSNLQALLQDVTTAASKKVNDSNRENILKQVTALLIENHDFKVPEWLITSEAQYLTASAKLTWDELSDDVKTVYLNLAEANVKVGLILDKMREEEPEAQLSDEEVINIIKRNVSQSSASPDEALQNMAQSGYLQILVARVRDEHALDFILKNSKVVE